MTLLIECLWWLTLAAAASSIGFSVWTVVHHRRQG